MMYVAGENLLPILVGLLIGFITGLWIWKFARTSAAPGERVLTEETGMRRPYVENRPPTATPAARNLPAARDPEDEPVPGGPRAEPEVLARRTPVAAPRAVETDDVGDNDIASSAAAAVEDLADQFLGIDAHPAPNDRAGGPANGGDDLQAMKGVGPKLAALLRGEGITRYDQIAALKPDDLARLDAHLGAFKGRLVRDRIVEQAAFLAAGDKAGYEQAFGRL